MNLKKNNSLSARKVISRRTFLQILNAALETKSLRFARQSAEFWLSEFTGDLEVSYLMAKAIWWDGNSNRAIAILKDICQLDPEYIEAQEMLAKALSEDEASPHVDALSCVYAMGKSIGEDFPVPEWSFLFRSAWQSFLGEQFEVAEDLIRQVVALKPDLPLAAILHLKIAKSRKNDIASVQLANIYHSRWPDCLQFALILAEIKMEMGDEADAVDLLHQCVTRDIVGQVPNRLWGAQHPYKTLWPGSFDIEFELPVPAPVASYLGWNKLPPGELILNTPSDQIETKNGVSTNKGARNRNQINEDFYIDTRHIGMGRRTKTRFVKNECVKGPSQYRNGENSEVIAKVEEVFTDLAQKLKNPEIAKTDGRFPMYVVFSSKKGIIEKYGRQTFSVLDYEMKRLASAIQKKSGWGAITFYPDDAGSAVHFGLTVIDSVDPWNLKLAIADLDKFLAKKGSMIGALLIVGGPDIIPFHNLPNPTDDMDEEVPSDNPYSTVDGNYFMPEWPVGRLPGDSDDEPGLLLEQLRKLISNHSQVEEEQPWWMRLLRLFGLNLLWSRIFNKKLIRNTLQSFGYSAAVWRRASAEVYKPIGDGQTMLTSPPESSGSFDPNQIYMSKLSYFNLHGVEDSPNWYGQREIGDTSSGSDYPIAIRPEDVIKNGHSPKVVFTEACYGGHILDKKENEALSLRFIGIGTSAFVGSTCISYGSVRAPLIAADFLGYLFWKNIRDDYLAGDALVKAKNEYVKEMNKRQGFLDGEDQKTLISFVLYGDPLESLDFPKAIKKRAMRMKMQPSVNIMQAQDELSDQEQTVSDETLMEVKMALEPYLPGLDQADIRVSYQYLICDAEFKNCYLGGSLPKQHPLGADGNRKQIVVTIRKEVKSANISHYHYARAKLDPSGNLIGLAVSR